MFTAFKPLRIGLTGCALLAVVAFAQSQVSAAGGIQSACGGQQFTDVCPGDWYYSYVTDLVSSGAVSGYSDGTFRPNATVTRGQIMKVIVVAFGLEGAPAGEQTFADVPTSNPFYDWIEAAAAHGDVNGYNCGGAGEPCDAQRRQYFHPTANVNRGQIAKMVVNAMGWSMINPQTPTFRDVPTGSAYFSYVETAGYYGVLGGYNCGGSNEPCPGRYFRPLVSTTRGQAAKIIDPAARLRPTPTFGSATATRTRTPTARATYTPSRTPTSTAGFPCPMFPADNIWNRNISALPTHALSDSYIASMGLSTGLHADFGSGLWDGAPIGIPYVAVPNGQPRVPITFDYADESDPGPYPVPTNAPIEGGPQSTGDRHVLVVQTGSCNLYEMYSSYPNRDGSWSAGSGAVWSFFSNALRPAGWTSADAAGLPILPGLPTTTR